MLLCVLSLAVRKPQCHTYRRSSWLCRLRAAARRGSAQGPSSAVTLICARSLSALGFCEGVAAELLAALWSAGTQPGLRRALQRAPLQSR